MGSLWAEEAGVDLVMTTIDPVQTKAKILDMIANVLEQKRRYPLGRDRIADKMTGLNKQ